MTGEGIVKSDTQQKYQPTASITNQAVMENSRDTRHSSPLIPHSDASSASGHRHLSQSVVEFPLWRPVTDDSLRRSFVLPSAATLAAVKQATQAPNEPRTISNDNGNSKKGNSKEEEGGGGTDRPISPMATLLIRTDY